MTEHFPDTRAVIDGAGVGIAIINREGRTLMINAALSDFLGYTQEEMIERTPADVTHPDDVAQDFALFRDLLAGVRSRYTIDKRYIHKTGAVVWARLTVSMVREESGDYAVAVVEDITDRRLAEETIRESEERFRLLAERISEVFYVSAPDPLRVLYASEAYEKVWQRSRQELYADARAFVEPIPESDRAAVFQALERQLAGEETEVAYRLVRQDGSVRWIRDRAYPIVRGGRVFRIVGLAADVTSAHDAAMEIHRAHERYELAARATNDVIWDWDAAAGTIIWNDGLRTMFGYDPDQIDNRLQWWDQHIHPEDRARVVASINRVIESSATSWIDEYRFERADGSYAEVLDRGYITRAADGRPLRMIGAMLDVTERKRAERLAAFMAEASATLASSLDYESTLKRVAELAVPVLADWCAVDLDQRLAVAPCEDKPEGEELVVPLAVPGSVPFGALTLVAPRNVKVAEDLARRAAMAIEHARLLAEAQKANRAKDDFLATLSHELRTPLTAIVGWARLLAETDLDPETRRLGLETIHRSAAAQARLIDDVLDVSRVTTGKLRLSVEPLSMEEVVRRSIGAVRLAAEAKSIDLVFTRTSAAWVTGDPDRLQQVVWNLLTNAIKFTPPGGRVEIAVETMPGAVRLIVSDTGQGIAPEFLPHVFEPFRQAEAGTMRLHGGLGLGLAIVRYLTEAHGGTVSAFSEGVNRGSRFTIELPSVAMVEHADVAARRPDIVSLSGLRVLFVDDQEDARQLAAIILSRAGAEPVIAATVPEALAIVERNEIDAVVSDIAMPGADGFALIRELRKSKHRTPAIAVSALGTPEDRERALTAGFDAYVNKPMEPDALVAEIARTIGRA